MIYIAIIALLILFSLIVIIKKRNMGHLRRSFEMSLFLVRLPRYESKENVDEKVAIAKTEQFYSNFLYINKGGGFLKRFFSGDPRVAFEIASELGGSDISFYIAVPLEYENALNKYVQGVYPGAVLEKKSNDYTIFEPKASSSLSFLKLQNTFFLPINTYKELGGDPLESITNSVTNIAADEGAAIQIVLRPAPFDLKRKGDSILSDIIKNGKTLSKAISDANAGILSGVFKEFGKIIFDKKDSDKIEGPGTDETTVEIIRNKIKKPAFEVNVRFVAVAKDKNRSEQILQNLESSFSQFSSSANGFKVNRVKGSRKARQFVYDFSFRNFQSSQSNILNTEELASIYHFPLSHMESPYIKWTKSKEAPPPAELPNQGEIFIGEAVYRGEKRPVYIASVADRRRHFYNIGMTGTGKSTLLREMIRQDIANGNGVGVIDPHGELIEHTLANIPKERMEDVVIFDPSDMDRPCGLNMLEWSFPEEKDLAVSEMITIFTSLFPPEMIGPMFEHYMRNAMLAIMADKDNPGTLVEIPRIFTDNTFMEERLSKVSDPLVRSFWIKEWKQTTGQTRSDMLGYVVSKIGRFIENEMMRNIIGQSYSGFNLSDIMDNKKIFLANLSKGLIGEVNSNLLGLILVSKMQMAALRRARIPEEDRQDFFLYIDEFQNFTTPSISTILSEARKYRLSLILAHQYIPQLKEEIKDAVIGNVGTITSYRIGTADAEFLESQFSPEFSKFDLTNLDNFQYITKMLVNNKVTSPFKIAAPRPTKGNPEMIGAIKEFSRLKYGRPRIIVEQEIIKRSKLGT